MLTKEMLKRLEEVTQLDAIPGHENFVMKYLQAEFSRFGYELVTDNLGSLFALKQSKQKNAKRVMVASHADEVGLSVSEIRKDGLLKVSARGGIDPLTLLAQRMRLTTRSNDVLYGAVDALAPHLSGSNNVKIANLNLDFGFTSDKEAKTAGVNIGDMVVTIGDFKVLNNGKRIMSKAFDNRYGVFMALEVAERFRDIDLPYDLYIGATVQEEVGLRGAQTISHVINPDFALVLDCSPARDTMGGSEGGALGEGLLIRYFDRSMIANPALLTYQEQIANSVNVKTQYYMSTGGTDAGAIHLHHAGVPTLTHCICARGIHANSSIIDSSDLLGARKVLFKMLETLDEKQIVAFKESKYV